MAKPLGLGFRVYGKTPQDELLMPKLGQSYSNEGSRLEGLYEGFLGLQQAFGGFGGSTSDEL